MQLEQLIRRHLATGLMMQLATVSNGQPWCCTVYFAQDDKLNIFWISTPQRRHSQEIHQCQKVAAAIPIQYIPGQPVVGLSIAGHAQRVDDTAEFQPVLRRYAARYGKTEQWYQDFLAGKNKHKLYWLKPSLFVVFDEVAFPDDPRKEWRL